MSNMLNRLLPSVLWPLVIVLATWGAWAVVTREEPIHRPGPARINEPIDKIPPAVVDQPVLEEVSADGTVRWTLYLDRITREEGSVMELAQPRALYRFQSGEALEVNARMGTYDEEAGILRLTGDVRGSARNTAFAFSVNQMTWDSVAGLLTASGGVEVTRDGIRLEGENLVLDLSQEFERIQVTGGVEITSAPEVIENLSRFDLERPG